MRIKSVIIILCFVSLAYSQQTANSKADLLSNEIKKDVLFNGSDITQRTTKSPGLAFIYSLALPGMGQLYTQRFDVGKYFLIGEAALWLSYTGFSVYADWIEQDAFTFAERNAGVNSENKDEDFWINIGLYDNVEQYNNEMLSTGQYEKVYYPETGYDFSWISSVERKKYREENLSVERVRNDRKFITAAVIVNHVISAISAIILTNAHNSKVRSSGGLKFDADVLRYNDKVHGIKLSMTKWF